VLPDAPGHGGSAHIEANLWATADLLAGLVPGAASWAGYSMGGRAALHVALAHPEKVARLVLISTSAGIEDQAARSARQAADEDLAKRVEVEGVESFLNFWMSQPLFATLSPEQAGHEARMVNTPAGLASSLRLAGQGAQEPLWARLAELGRRSYRSCSSPVSVMAATSTRPGASPPPSALPPRCMCWPGPATPATSSARPRWPRSWLRSLARAEQGRRTGATVNTKGDRFPTLCGIARR